MKTKNNKGFTLVELMVTVAIIGALGAIAYPSYTAYTQKGKCADGTGPLMTIAGRMEEYYLNNDTYVGATVGSPGTVGESQSPKGLYTLAVASATKFAYTLTATPADTAQNTLKLDSLGKKTETGGTTGVATTCW
ncbi:MAG TPA: prepilin-type N-terminal cleavage/methylation domain-containing protein [Gammaproteobacteria bacterium]|nr:prepilin-type N-terminal cleavage/methylation domain-containing protein [Gammaproteobacteria bacterium]